MDWKKAFTYMLLDKKTLTLNSFWGGIHSLFMVFGIVFAALFFVFFVTFADKILSTFSGGLIAILLMSVLLGLCIVSPFCLMGYCSLITKNCVQPIEKVLPDWFKNFCPIFSYGIRFCFGVFLLFLLICIPLAVFTLIGGFLGNVIFLFITLLIIITVLIMAYTCFWILSNAMLINFIHKNSLFAIFNIKELIKIIKIDISDYFCILGIELGISALASVVVQVLLILLILPIGIYGAGIQMSFPANVLISILGIIIGAIILSLSGLPFFYCCLVDSHLVGQYYKKYLASLEE